LETWIVGFGGHFVKAGFPRGWPQKSGVPVYKARSMTLHQRPSLFSVELRTTRWAELVAWYRNVLGLRVLVRVVDDGYALFEAGDTRLAILSRPSPGEASHRWSLGFEVVDLDEVHARLAETDADVTAPKIHAEGFRELITADPDGNRVRLFSWPAGH
jgi:predicted enzyme related to lactoylglutathione lyase